MAKTTFINNASGLSKPKGVWSHVAISEPGTMVFICGVVSVDADGNFVGKGDMAAQTRQTCENVKAGVEAAGGTLADIVRVDVYTTNVDEFDAIHAVRREYFSDNPPVSTMVEVTRLVRPDAWIEINAIAVL